MIVSSEIEIVGNSRNIKYYTQKGYKIEVGKKIKIKPTDLSEGSTFKIIAQCDSCNSQKLISWSSYFKYTIGCTSEYYCVKCNNIKRQKTNNIKYGGNSPLCSRDILEKAQNTNLKKWGSKCTLQSEQLKDKIKTTFIHKYGVDSPLKSIEIQSKCRETLMNNYGVDVPLKSTKILDKLKKTNIEKYGFENIFQSEKIKTDLINQQIEKYGDLYVRTDEFKKLSKQTSLEKYGNEFYARSEDFIRKIISEKTDTYNIEIEYYDFNDKTYHVKCNKCQNISKMKSDIIYSRNRNKVDICVVCNPIGNKYVSSQESKIFDFLEENGIVCEKTNKKIIHPYHLDIYNPDNKIAIEFNGLWWHNEFYKDKNYHKSKYESCLNQGVNLLQIWEDDWLYKQDIIKSIILNKFNKSNKIYARKCEIKLVHHKMKDLFLDENHIQGKTKSSINIGLFFNNELVSLMTFGKRRINNKQEFELLRFCNKLNISVIGGASKIFNYFIKNYEYDKIISYSDNSISNGNLYKKLGFTYIHTSLNYYWCDGKIKYHRFNFNKKKLIRLGYDSSLTENEIMHSRKFYKIWGCGNKRWEFNLV